MPDVPKQCPECGERFHWYEAECPDCRVALVDAPTGPTGDPDLGIASVFHTSDMALLPLARIALDAEGIEYQVKDTVGAAEIFVTTDLANRAREVLADLQQESTEGEASHARAELAAPPAGTAGAVVRLVDDETHQLIGDITEDQLDVLLAHLEQESSDDRDFYLSAGTIELLADKGADAALLDMLRRALGDREGIDVRWDYI